MKKLYTYEARVYNLKADELTTEFITSEIPPDLAKSVGIHREGKEIYLGRVWKLNKPVANLTLPTINYDH